MLAIIYYQYNYNKYLFFPMIKTNNIILIYLTLTNKLAMFITVIVINIYIYNIIIITTYLIIILLL